MRRILKKIVVSINIFFIFMLSLTYLAQIVKPTFLAFLQVLSLSYFYLLLINIGFVIFWIVKKSKWAFLSLGFIALGYDNLQSTFQINFAEEGENTIKLISYNVRAFDRYDWTKQKNSKQKIFEFIQAEQPDIVCYQEFFSKDKAGYSTFDTLLLIQKAKNHHLAYYKLPKELNLSGVAIFSVYPIVSKGVLELDEHIFSIFVDLKIENDTIRVYNNHLQSVHFGEDNYNFIDNIENAEQEEMVPGIKNIYKKLVVAYEKRLEQSNLLTEHINECKHPKIICGDFNDGSNSYTYDRIKGNLLDAFEEKGFGFGFSYVRGILKFRIDFIFHSHSIQTLDFSTKRQNYSDHYPLIFKFRTASK